MPSIGRRPRTMHLSSPVSDFRRLRIASILLLINRMLLLAAVGLLVVSLFANERDLMIFGSIFVAISVLLLVAQWIVASQVGCPMCKTPVFSPIRCLKHRKARRLLGSYHLRVALAIMFTDRFRCPFCNQKSEVNLTDKVHINRRSQAHVQHRTRSS